MRSRAAQQEEGGPGIVDIGAVELEFGEGAVHGLLAVEVPVDGPLKVLLEVLVCGVWVDLTQQQHTDSVWYVDKLMVGLKFSLNESKRHIFLNQDTLIFHHPTLSERFYIQDLML